MLVFNIFRPDDLMSNLISLQIDILNRVDDTCSLLVRQNFIFLLLLLLFVFLCLHLNLFVQFRCLLVVNLVMNTVPSYPLNQRDHCVYYQQNENNQLDNQKENHKSFAHAVISPVNLFIYRHTSKDEQGELKQPVSNMSIPRVEILPHRMNNERDEDKSEEDDRAYEVADDSNEHYTHSHQHSDGEEPNVVKQN